MLRHVAPEVWCWDTEFVPDPDVGRVIQDAPGADDDSVVEQMWAEERRKSSKDEERPFLPLPLQRVVSIAAVVRRQDQRGTCVDLVSRPKEAPIEDECAMIDGFLSGLSSPRPCPVQLVGWASTSADMFVLLHRAMRYGLSYPSLIPPQKPWDGADYFSSKSAYHVDLMNDLFGWGRKSTLNDMAACLCVPGKMEVSGDNVYDMWKKGRVQEIRQYCEHDALTTYLVWLRAAHFVGLLDGTAEEVLLRDMLVAKNEPHLQAFLERWEEVKWKAAEK